MLHLQDVVLHNRFLRRIRKRIHNVTLKLPAQDGRLTILGLEK